MSPLLTDLYQLTMAYGYWRLGLHEREAVFHLSFRHAPFKGDYAIACGLASVVDFLKEWHFSEDDLAYVAGLKASNDQPLFSSEFIHYLRNLTFTGDIDAIPEGTAVFANQPLIRVKAPLLQGQMLESIILNIINFQTLIATKAARVCQAAEGDKVLEFGLRRAQGVDGALSASRAAYIGGCDATSNVLAGKQFGIPVCGTHAHSWVTVFPNEITAFENMARVLPGDCTLLVDTYDTIQGVKNAIEIGQKLKREGRCLAGIRLDSGDLVDLSIKARRLLDDAGFTNTQIVASNNLDDVSIALMKQQGAKISAWGVGTRLATAFDQPALDGVYKLSALRDERGVWKYKLKLSETAAKVSHPGIGQIRRFTQSSQPLMDVLYDVEMGISERPNAILFESSQRRVPPVDAEWSDLLVPIFSKGKLICSLESIHDLRQRALSEVVQFSSSHSYPVSLEENLHRLKQQLISGLFSHD